MYRTVSLDQEIKKYKVKRRVVKEHFYPQSVLWPITGGNNDGGGRINTSSPEAAMPEMDEKNKPTG